MSECIIAIAGRSLKAINFKKGFWRKHHRQDMCGTAAQDVRGRRLTILIEGEELFIKQGQMPKVGKPLIGKLVRNQLYSFIKDVNRVIYSFKISRSDNNMEIITYCFNWLNIDLLKDLSSKNRIRTICFVQEVLMEITAERHDEENFIMIAQCNGSMYFVVSSHGSMICNRVISSSSREEMLEALAGEIDRSKSLNGTDRQVMYLINIADDEIESKCKDGFFVVRDTINNEEICMRAARKSKLNFKTMWHLEEVEKKKDNARKGLVIGLFVSCLCASEAYVLQHVKRAEAGKELQKLENREKGGTGDESNLSSIDLMSSILSDSEICGSIDNMTIRGREVEITIKCEDEEKRKISLIEEKMKNKVTSFTYEQNGLCSLKIEAK